MYPPVSTQTVDRGASPGFPSIPCLSSSYWCHPGRCMQTDSGLGQYASRVSGIAAAVPPAATFIIRPRRDPSDSAQQCCAGRSFAHSSFIPGLLHPCGRPGFHSEQTSHTPWFPGSLSPRTAAHFVFVRSVKLCEQTTRPSRTDSCSGASPYFPHPSPLSGGVLTNKLLIGSLPGLPGTTGPSEFLLSPCRYRQVHALALRQARMLTGATPVTSWSSAQTPQPIVVG